MWRALIVAVCLWAMLLGWLIVPWLPLMAGLALAVAWLWADWQLTPHD